MFDKMLNVMYSIYTGECNRIVNNMHPKSGSGVAHTAMQAALPDLLFEPVIFCVAGLSWG